MAENPLDDLDPVDDIDLMDDVGDPDGLGIIEPDTSTKWPKVIGILSLIYAVGGLLCVVSTIAMTALGDVFARAGGMDLHFPPSVRYPAVVLGAINFVLGIVMLTGAISLLRRRRTGVSRLKKWAAFRLATLLLGLVTTMFTLPAQLDIQRQVIEFQSERAREGGRPDLAQEFDEDEQWFNVIRNTAIATAVFAAFPLFLGFYLSRRKITDEVQNWM